MLARAKGAADLLYLRDNPAQGGGLDKERIQRYLASHYGLG